MTFFKHIIRSFKSNILRFFAILLIVFIGTTFVSGIGSITPKVYDTYNNYLIGQNISDVNIKSKKDVGFSNKDIETFENSDFTGDFYTCTQMDLNMKENYSSNEDYYIRFIFLSSNPDEITVNKLSQHNNGNKIDDYNEVYVENEENSSTLTENNINDEIIFTVPETEISIKFKIINKVRNPLFFHSESDYALTEDSWKKDSIKVNIKKIVYVDKNFLKFSDIPFIDKMIKQNLPITDIYSILPNIRNENTDLTSSKYRSLVNKEIEKIRQLDNFKETPVDENISDEEKEEAQKDDTITILPLEKEQSYAGLTNICDKITIISAIFPIFFISIVALVVSTTMARMVEEDRPTIGTLKSLGQNNFKILCKYFIFVLTASLIGGIPGVFLGAYFIPDIIIPAFAHMYILPPVISKKLTLLFGFICFAATIFIVLLVTLFASLKNIKEKPANLFRSKAPKPGRKILLERIGFIWKHLPFKLKSTFRNVFRYVLRFLMVVLSTLFCTAVLFAGLSLNDVKDEKVIFSGVAFSLADVLGPISAVIIIFSLVLNALVLYNLINMMISERTKEIATLKVLGYHINEVCGYIFREVLIMVIIGAIAGTPVGLGFVFAVFKAMSNFASISSIQWYTYLITPVATIIISILVDLLFILKIKRIDMNDSLKSYE